MLSPQHVTLSRSGPSEVEFRVLHGDYDLYYQCHVDLGCDDIGLGGFLSLVAAFGSDREAEAASSRSVRPSSRRRAPGEPDAS